MSDTKKAALTVRLDSDLIAEFKRVCDENDYSQSFVIRELIKDYISKNKQRDLFKWANTFNENLAIQSTAKKLNAD